MGIPIGFELKQELCEDCTWIGVFGKADEVCGEWFFRIDVEDDLGGLEAYIDAAQRDVDDRQDVGDVVVKDPHKSVVAEDWADDSFPLKDRVPYLAKHSCAVDLLGDARIGELALG